MKSYYTNEVIQILYNYGIDNDTLAEELGEYIDSEVRAVQDDALEDYS